jgi:hypothetical protein
VGDEHQLLKWVAPDWHAIGTPLNGSIDEVVLMPSGDLVAIGTFTAAGSVRVNHIARFDGTNWNPLGDGLEPFSSNSGATCMALLPNGDLVVGGSYFYFGASLANIAHWNGETWLPFGNGLNNTILDLHAAGNGDLIAAGSFKNAGGSSADYLARWDGNEWHAIGNGVNGPVNHILELSNGDIIMGGSFHKAGSNSVNNIARWNGTDWLDLDGGIDGAWSQPAVGCLAEVPNHEFAAIGNSYFAGGQGSAFFARWTETGLPWIAWQPQGANVPAGDTAKLHVNAASGYGELTYQWRHAGVELVEGLTPHGSIISGAKSPSLSINNAQQADAGAYELVIANECGESISDPAIVTIVVVGDITGDGNVDVDDLLAVINGWGPCPAPPDACAADIAPGGGGDGAVDVDDLLMVINNWG